MDLPKYVVPFFEVDTLQEWGRESSSVKSSIVQYVPDSFQFEQPSFTFALQKLTVFKVLDYGSHPVIYGVRAINGLWLICQMDTWLVEEFYTITFRGSASLVEAS